MVAAIGNIKSSIGGKRQAERRIETGHSAERIYEAALLWRARDGDDSPIRRDLPDGVISSIRNKKIVIWSDSNAARSIEAGCGAGAIVVSSRSGLAGEGGDQTIGINFS